MLAPIQDIWLQFVADRTNGCACDTVLRLSVVVVCIVAKQCVLEQKLLLCLMTYKALNGLAPSYIANPVDQSQPSAADRDSDLPRVVTL